MGSFSSPDPQHPSCSMSTMSCLSPPPGDSRTIASRPKLTLQTTSLPRTFGSSTTGLSFSFAAGPGASPTVRNTFKNAYDVSSPSSATSSPPKCSSHRFPSSKPISPYVLHSNTNSFSYRSPYQLPLGVRSILRNSPLEPAARRRSGSISAGASGPGGAGARRVFFPAKKQVSYRLPLEEEIRTERFTAQHLDLIRQEEAALDQAESESEDQPIHPETEDNDDSDLDSDASLSQSETSTSDEASADEAGAEQTTLSKLERKKRRTMRIERQVRAVALLDGLEPDAYASSTPQTPHQGRAKRRREWKWTLGPIDAGPGSALSEATTLPVPSDVPSCNVSESQAECKPSSS